MYKHLATEDLINIANQFALDNWERVYPERTWNGFDLVGENYIFQLSHLGWIGVYDNDTISRIDLSHQIEDNIRKELLTYNK